ncbi:elongation factor P [Thermodesulfovibrionales bacterium]|nr:elongation factor P [Thermodesulfovibrionales bacterium]MCL0034081.1 elongation factor P [Thermodesulfovibrionales bacterium]MCL0040172.1 elongation factor P [Thermodesulfovibrionales bacterium]MCL0040655.1 elongation factor P [Thermodesulfovibrionales bacterium]MCL0050159.1 elongation factor P [Thermodesulfovibrionales bacterium]
MIATNDFKRGTKIDYKGEPYEVIEFQHVKMQQRAPIVKTKIKNLKTGRVLEETFSAGEKFESPNLEEKDMQYIYSQDDLYYFLDMKTYEQIPLTSAQIGDTKKLIKEGMTIKILYYKNMPMIVEPPMFVELEVVETEPSFKGDTASGSNKPARLETGLVVKVPFHIEIGEVLRIDTRTSEYIEKVRDRKDR